MADNHNHAPTHSISTPLVVVAALCVIVAFARLAAPVLNPILLSAWLAALAYPLFKRLHARLGKRVWALGATVAAVVVGMLVFTALLFASAGALLDGLSRYQTLLTERLAPLASIGAGAISVESLSAALHQVLTAFTIGVAGAAGDVFFSIVLAALLLLQSRALADLLTGPLQAYPALAVAPDVMRAVVRAFGIRTRLNFLTGLGMAVFLLIVGVDYALVWGALVFLLSYVPYIGLFVAMTPPVLLAFAEHGWVSAALCIVAAAVVNLTIENVVEPNYTGKQLRLSPPVVMAAFFIFVWLFGPVGAVIAMPLTVTIALICDRYAQTRWVTMIMTGSRTLTPPSQPPD